MTPKGQTRDPNTLAQYLENSTRYYLATIRWILVCCEAVYTVGYPSDSLASCLGFLADRT